MNAPTLLLLIAGLVAASERQTTFADRQSQPSKQAKQPGSSKKPVKDDAALAKEIEKLWAQALRHNKRKEWDKLENVAREIIKRDPHLLKVYEFFSWNWAYNVSAEYEAVPKRYEMIKKGVSFALLGLKHNHDNPYLIWYTGILVGDKIGRHDSHRELRRLFRDDKAFHKILAKHVPMKSALGIDGKPDHWLVARQFFLRANKAIDDGKKQERMADIVFRIRPMHCLSGYAETLQDEGRSGKAVVKVWSQAFEEWKRFGERRFDSRDGKVRLNHPSDSPRTVATLRKIINYQFWLQKTAAEQTPEFLDGRKWLYELRHPPKNAPFPEKKYKKTFELWESIFSRNEFMLRDEGILEPIAEAIQRFQKRGKRIPAESAAAKLRDRIRTSHPRIYQQYFSSRR